MTFLMTVGAAVIVVGGVVIVVNEFFVSERIPLVLHDSKLSVVGQKFSHFERTDNSALIRGTLDKLLNH